MGQTGIIVLGLHGKVLVDRGQGNIFCEKLPDPTQSRWMSKGHSWSCGKLMLEQAPARVCSLVETWPYSGFGFYFALSHSDMIGYKSNQILLSWACFVHDSNCWVISPCPYLDPCAFCYNSSPLPSWMGHGLGRPQALDQITK